MATILQNNAKLDLKGKVDRPVYHLNHQEKINHCKNLLRQFGHNQKELNALDNMNEEQINIIRSKYINKAKNKRDQIF